MWQYEGSRTPSYYINAIYIRILYSSSSNISIEKYIRKWRKIKYIEQPISETRCIQMKIEEN